MACLVQAAGVKQGGLKAGGGVIDGRCGLWSPGIQCSHLASAWTASALFSWSSEEASRPALPVRPPPAPPPHTPPCLPAGVCVCGRGGGGAGGMRHAARVRCCGTAQARSGACLRCITAAHAARPPQPRRGRHTAWSGSCPMQPLNRGRLLLLRWQRQRSGWLRAARQGGCGGWAFRAMQQNDIHRQSPCGMAARQQGSTCRGQAMALRVICREWPLPLHVIGCKATAETC